MMISPEYYRQTELDGKSPEVIERKIRSLKREMTKYRRMLNNPCDCPEEFMIKPNPQVRLSCTRDYFEEAKKALIEAGGKYVPSPKELRAEKFIENLPNIIEICYEETAENVHRIYTCTFEDNHPVVTRTEENSEEKHIAIDRNWTKEEVLDEIRHMHMEDWKKVYQAPEDPEIPDFGPWKLKIRIQNESEKSNKYTVLRYEGINRAPYSLSQLINLFEDITNNED